MSTPNTPFKKRERGPIINFPRFSIWASVEGGKRAQLVFGIQDGNPRITVFYPKTDATDTRTPSSTVAMGMDTAMALFKAMEQLAKKPENRGMILKMENTRNTFEQGSTTPTGKAISTVFTFGRDEEGMYYIEIKDVMYPKPSVKFPFLFGSWHNLMLQTAEGIKPIPRTQLSQCMVEGMIEALRWSYCTLSLPAGAGVSASLPDDGPAGAAGAAVAAAVPKAPPAAKENFDDVTF